jgi:hypothetical protein
MNGKIKFHKATGPAFNVGEVWVGSDGNTKVTIVGVSKYPGATSNHTSDYSVTYEWNGVQYEKDAWNFQVRYTHQADLSL